MTAALPTLMAGKPGQKNWETTASDYTKVSLTPGKDDTELNFAWYSKKDRQCSHSGGSFWNRQRKPGSFEGTSGDVDQDLTGDLTYEYNHVTVTDLKTGNHLLLYR